MFIPTIIALLFCISTVSINALEHCSGVSTESQEDFKWKYDTAPIVAYGMVSDLKTNLATFQVSCVLKGELSVSSIELAQMADVMNTTECHYLTVNKNYIVFLESMKPAGSNSKNLYRLADMEEIEISSNTVKNYINDECEDEDDFGIEMTMFYYDNNLKCGQFSATCDSSTTKIALPALNYPQLTKKSIFLGGFKKTLEVPTMNANDDGSISGKKSGVDDSYRSIATISTIWMPIVVLTTGLTMMINI